jgi:hypothetical protein
VGDVYPPQASGRHYLVPLHSDIQVRARRLGLDCLQPILWHKIANGATEAERRTVPGFTASPTSPVAHKNDIGYILFLRKGGEYRSAPTLQKALSKLTQQWGPPHFLRHSRELTRVCSPKVIHTGGPKKPFGARQMVAIASWAGGEDQLVRGK